MRITLDSRRATRGICSVEGVGTVAGSHIDCFALSHLSTFLNARLVRLKEGEKQMHPLLVSCRIHQAEREHDLKSDQSLEYTQPLFPRFLPLITVWTSLVGESQSQSAD